ncbi:MAG: patatin family protein [Spirochaetales bacterium]|jgi:predicted patatin/cPLA2 family phospholipase|nr:patatin family protein [Spirochaetales bacterium]
MENLNLENAALVLEGGGLRGTFSSGVLRRFVDDKLYFAYVIGVSMGACNAANYVALQPERNRLVNTRYVKDSRYISYRRLFSGGDLFGMDFIFREIPGRLIPFDFETFLANPMRCVTVVSDCVTGEALYYEKSELGDDYLEVLKASSSLPFIAKAVPYKGRFLMDGGLADSIPVRRAAAEGWKKIVVILTRPKGYRKKPSRLPGFLLRGYRKFPGLLRNIENRYKDYNETMDYIEEREGRGEIFVIRPDVDPPAGRVERNVAKIYLTYDQGYAAACARFGGLLEYVRG